MQAFTIFLQSTTTLFHVYTQGEVDELLGSSLGEDGEVSPSILCEACAIAAVGSRYAQAQIPPDVGDYYFNVAKHSLDDCVKQMPFRAIKACALLAFCNIVDKATTAFAYVGKPT